MMREITFSSMEIYDYVDPHPEKEYNSEEFKSLGGRHQLRVKKAAKEKGSKFNTLKCELCTICTIIVCVMHLL